MPARHRTASATIFASLRILPLALLPLVACTSDPTELPLCCSEFNVGATISAEIGGGAKGRALAQATADFAAIAGTTIEDLTARCRSIAQDLDAPADQATAAEASADRNAKLDAWCKLATTAIASAKGRAGGTIKVVAEAPRCEASVSARASCQADCNVSGSCNVQATPPRCNGGRLEIACKGGCTAKAGATLACEGRCEGTCKGSCTARGGVSVDCDGRCEGTCAAGGSANGGGIQADGTCKGTCSGTCTARAEAPAVACSGTCSGECGVKCSAEAGASVTCDGECDAAFEPLRCEGGKLEGGCEVDAQCNAGCDASVSAKAECKPPTVSVAIEGALDANASARLQATLEANLGAIFALDARAAGMVNVGGAFLGEIKNIGEVKVACIPVIVATAIRAVDDVAAGTAASASVIASVK